MDGREIVWAQTPGVEHIYEQDYSRNLAMKRVGSTQGAIASGAGADQRKTATEVSRKNEKRDVFHAKARRREGRDRWRVTSGHAK